VTNSSPKGGDATLGSLLVTGGAGFLGSYFVRLALQMGASKVTNVDLLSYAGDTRRLEDLNAGDRYQFIQADVADTAAMRKVVAEIQPTAIVHYAAESHVTRSEADPDRFFRTNVEGTRAVLDAALECGVERVVHISTDEVYGPIEIGLFRESDKPEGFGMSTSAYAQSKAAADDLARSYSDKLQVVVARPTNAFGPWQFPEKAFPRWITKALQGQPLLVWGDGMYVRQWLFAEDFAKAIAVLLLQGAAGEVYNVGPIHDPEINNLDLAQWIAAHLGLDGEAVQLTPYDRPNHDRRYAVDPAKIEALGWRPGNVERQFEETVKWYQQNDSWWRPHLAEAESIYRLHSA